MRGGEAYPCGTLSSEVHDALNKARHVCERRRDGEAAVSRENEAGGLFQPPAGYSAAAGFRCLINRAR